jgi:hypothetical protein
LQLPIACLGLSACIGLLKAQDLEFKSTNSPSSLIELYSSEGCSSCPPAEEWTNHLKSDPGLWKDVFPLVFHVDYWDGLGWPDRFARPEYTQRQRDYAARLGQDSVYTPEFVRNGLEWRRSWLGGDDIRPSGTEKSGTLVLTVHPGERTIDAVYATGGSAPGQALTLNVALLGFDLVTDVKRGENGGRTLNHDFVVLHFNSTPLTVKADGTFPVVPVEIKSATGDTPGAVVAWVSTAGGSIAQVAGGWLPSAGERSN